MQFNIFVLIQLYNCCIKHISELLLVLLYKVNFLTTIKRFLSIVQTSLYKKSLKNKSFIGHSILLSLQKSGENSLPS